MFHRFPAKYYIIEEEFMELIYYDGFLFKNKSNVFSIVVEEPEALYGTSQPWRELGVTKELYEERYLREQGIMVLY